MTNMVHIHRRLINEALDKMKRTQKWEPPAGADLAIDLLRLEKQVCMCVQSKWMYASINGCMPL